MNTTKLPVDIVSHHIVKPMLDVYYPQLANMKDKHVEQKLNERIMRQVQTMISKQTGQGSEATSITGGFEIKNNQRNIISLTNSHYSYSAGAAHGMTIQRSLTMDVETGQIYQLKDLFKPNADYVKRINEIIERQIKERDLPLIKKFNGIHPNQFYYIADKALVIYFQLYELVPYAWGFPYFVISVYEVQDIVLDDGPFGRMSY